MSSGPAPPRPRLPLAPAAAGFRFQSAARERSGERDEARGSQGAGPPIPACARPPVPMASAALWTALAVGLQLWAAGHAVPTQVGASRGQRGAPAPHAHRPGAHPGAPVRPGRARERPGSAHSRQGVWGSQRDPRRTLDLNALAPATAKPSFPWPEGVVCTGALGTLFT